MHVQGLWAVGERCRLGVDGLAVTRGWELGRWGNNCRGAVAAAVAAGDAGGDAGDDAAVRGGDEVVETNTCVQGARRAADRRAVHTRRGVHGVWARANKVLETTAMIEILPLQLIKLPLSVTQHIVMMYRHTKAVAVVTLLLLSTASAQFQGLSLNFLPSVSVDLGGGLSGINAAIMPHADEVSSALANLLAVNGTDDTSAPLLSAVRWCAQCTGCGTGAYTGRVRAGQRDRQRRRGASGVFTCC